MVVARMIVTGMIVFGMIMTGVIVPRLAPRVSAACAAGVFLLGGQGVVNPLIHSDAIQGGAMRIGELATAAGTTVETVSPIWKGCA
ncbi:hypothetical protein G6F64_014865 [Rhizopus arrhizus]|uniref:Uncharacterized protein n=1 Tax=Rhizopus oryzae TaxID=64495 RepID=A0A9P6WSS4_RHIOR|nr:hypothetical protein G6F64_014865 [Rhizopus arrhizus]